MCIKKTILYKERDEKKREEYLQQISCYDPENIVYIDESGFDQNINKNTCWAEKGAKIISETPGSRKKRVSVIAGLANNKFIAPFRFFGYTDTGLFLVWLN